MKTALEGCYDVNNVISLWQLIRLVASPRLFRYLLTDYTIYFFTPAVHRLKVIKGELSSVFSKQNLKDLRDCKKGRSFEDFNCSRSVQYEQHVKPWGKSHHMCKPITD